MELLKKYQAQYTEFASIDDFNIEDRARRVPAEKHFWVCRLIDAKIERDKIYRQKTTTKNTLQKKIVEESPVTLNKQHIYDSIEETQTIENINRQIKEYDFIIEYLEKIVSQITFIGNDIKNIIELKKLQES